MYLLSTRFQLVSGDEVEAATSENEGKISNNLKLRKIRKMARFQNIALLCLRAKRKKVL